MDNVDLRHTVVAITGGAGGIGSALADAFVDAGAVAVTMDLPGRGADLDLDVVDLDAQRRVFAEIEARHGRLDVAVANAGIGVAGLAEDVSPDDWDRSIAVNIGGVTNTVQVAYPMLAQRGRGALVLMASLAGLGGTPLMAPYSMTKHAVVGLGTSLRIEAARHGVGVTVVCPGPVETPLLDERSRTPGLSVRRYLTASAGPPLAPATLAAAVVRGVRRNRALVIPGRAAVLAHVARHAPGVVARLSARGVGAELKAAHRR